MELTREQLEIINSTGNIKVNAVAGSGKTTTIIEYAKAQSKESKILYLAFNKSVKLEAIRKFSDNNIDNVKVETAHSLAYKHIVFSHNYVIRPHGFKVYEIANLLGLNGNGEKNAEYIVANHINKFITYFCNSNKQKVQDLNYLDTVTDKKARTFVNTYYGYIEKQTRLLLSKMDKGEIEITHDFYLKKFQLSNPKLNYDYILFDEGQDASAAMLDVFFKQKATKVIVGDTHQQIYGWRFAVNSLEKADYKTFNLSTSFRFNQDIANLAMEILGWKNHIEDDHNLRINGRGSLNKIKSKAVIARTNLGLLLKAIEYVSIKKKLKKIYFEGNINSYTYADDGTSLYDVLNLYNGNHRLIKDPLIKQMNDIEELEEYIKQTEDAQLSMLVEIVIEYGNEIPKIINEIKEKHVENKEQAEMIFSTVHKCKGMEYDAIQIANDFITEEKIEKIKLNLKDNDEYNPKLNEEINLLYVAITRTKNSIHIPETIIPENFPSSPQIFITKEIEKERKLSYDNIQSRSNINLNKSRVQDIEANYKEAYKPWTMDLDCELADMFNNGIKIKELAAHFERTRGAIRARIKRLELD